MDFKLTAEQEALRLRARDLADGTFRERAAGWDATEQYPWDNVKDLVRAGFMGLTIPREYGGAGASILDVLLVVEEIIHTIHAHPTLSEASLEATLAALGQAIHI